MRDVLRRQIWTLQLVLIVVAGTVSMLAGVPIAYAASSWEGHPAHRSVWKLMGEQRTRQASAFAVGPRLVVTVAHTLYNIENAGSSNMVLVQAGRTGKIKIAGPRAISATHDLALLETATPLEHHLTVARTLPHGLADQFHIAGYPKGRFDILSVITQTLHGDADYFRLPVDKVVLGGISGAPLLAPNGEVIAVQRRTDDNVAEGTRFEVLNKFLNGEIGVRCGSMTLKACLGAAAERTKQLAKDGEIAAQYQLGRRYRYIPGDPEVRWLRRAAESGHAGARTGLGNSLYFGELGLPEDWKQSFHWLRLAAEEEDPLAQLNLSSAYFFGEGVDVNSHEGMEWLHRALRNGYVGAVYNLGVMYYDGDGLPMDKEIGRYWLQRAAARGDEDARTVLEDSAD